MKTAEIIRIGALVGGMLCIAAIPFSIVMHVLGFPALDISPDILKWTLGIGVLLIALAIGFDKIRVSRDGVDLENTDG